MGVRGQKKKRILTIRMDVPSVSRIPAISMAISITAIAITTITTATAAAVAATISARVTITTTVTTTVTTTAAAATTAISIISATTSLLTKPAPAVPRLRAAFPLPIAQIRIITLEPGGSPAGPEDDPVLVRVGRVVRHRVRRVRTISVAIALVLVVVVMLSGRVGITRWGCACWGGGDRNGERREGC